MAKGSAKFYKRTSLFKVLGLLSLIFFTFYFIYNYLATGSFSLKPNASETPCAQRASSTTCNNGCIWTEPKYKTVKTPCSDNDCNAGSGTCKFITKTTTTPKYQCEEPGLTAQKCKTLGFEMTTTYVTTKQQVCEGQAEDLELVSAGFCSGTPILQDPVVQAPQGEPITQISCGDPKYCGDSGGQISVKTKNAHACVFKDDVKSACCVFEAPVYDAITDTCIDLVRIGSQAKPLDAKCDLDKCKEFVEIRYSCGGSRVRSTRMDTYACSSSYSNCSFRSYNKSCTKNNCFFTKSVESKAKLNTRCVFNKGNICSTNADCERTTKGSSNECVKGENGDTSYCYWGSN